MSDQNVLLIEIACMVCAFMVGVAVYLTVEEYQAVKKGEFEEF